MYIYYLIFSFLLLLAYFEVAKRFKIVDKPNHRSSHQHATILGGGIIFPVILLSFCVISEFKFPLFCIGLLIISAISYYDDLKPLPNYIRIICHLIAVSLAFLETHLFNESLWIIPIAYIVVIGTINAYNFMDGINGITASYSLVTLLSLLYINQNVGNFIIDEWLGLSTVAVLVFGVFNFRRRALCFAGDVGSVSMAFIIIFFLLMLIIQSGELKYIGLLLVYGLDTVITIIFRLIRRENIFEAHRSHFYQYLANVRSWPHLLVSVSYALVQLLVNIFLLNYSLSAPAFLWLVLFSGIAIVTMRLLVEGKKQLLSKAS